jgi:hypothetical protein
MEPAAWVVLGLIVLVGTITMHLVGYLVWEKPKRAARNLQFRATAAREALRAWNVEKEAERLRRQGVTRLQDQRAAAEADRAEKRRAFLRDVEERRRFHVEALAEQAEKRREFVRDLEERKQRHAEILRDLEERKAAAVQEIEAKLAALRDLEARKKDSSSGN